MDPPQSLVTSRTDSSHLLGQTPLGHGITPQTKIPFGERWAWAVHQTRWFPWGAEIVTGLVSMALTSVLQWQQQTIPMSFRAFIQSAEWTAFVIPIVVGAVVALIITPTAGFTKNLVIAKASILAQRLTSVWNDNVTLASMLNAYEHRKKETHDLLVTLAEAGRKLRDQWVRRFNSEYKPGLEAIPTLEKYYDAWQADCEAQLKPVLRYEEYQRVIDLRPVLPTTVLGTYQLGAPGCADIILRVLDRKIHVLDGLIGSEYTPPHGIFWDVDQYGVIARHLPRPSSSGNEGPPLPEGTS